jgi:hypothetical protein
MKRFLRSASLSHSHYPKQRTACSSAGSLLDAPRTLSHSHHPKQRTDKSALALSHSHHPKQRLLGRASLSHPHHRKANCLQQRWFPPGRSANAIALPSSPFYKTYPKLPMSWKDLPRIIEGLLRGYKNNPLNNVLVMSSYCHFNLFN